jgi:hypothetical protein
MNVVKYSMWMDWILNMTKRISYLLPKLYFYIGKFFWHTTSLSVGLFPNLFTTSYCDLGSFGHLKFDWRSSMFGSSLLHDHIYLKPMRQVVELEVAVEIMGDLVTTMLVTGVGN